MKVIATLLDPQTRQSVLARLHRVHPGTPARWGQLSAPLMLAHLCDSLRHMLGEIEIRTRSGIYRWPLVKPLVMYWLPWPKGKIKGPRKLFATPAGAWESDQATFRDLLERFVGKTGRRGWPDHPLFGAMTRQSWGRFAYRHFDHHLRQFGV